MSSSCCNPIGLISYITARFDPCYTNSFYYRVSTQSIYVCVCVCLEIYICFYIFVHNMYIYIQA